MCSCSHATHRSWSPAAMEAAKYARPRASADVPLHHLNWTISASSAPHRPDPATGSLPCLAVPPPSPPRPASPAAVPAAKCCCSILSRGSQVTPVRVDRTPASLAWASSSARSTPSRPKWPGERPPLSCAACTL